MQVVAAALIIPFVLLNLLGGIASGAWLLLVGEWRVVLMGLLFSVSGVFSIGLALLLGLLMGVPGGALVQKRGLLAITGWLLCAFNLLWTFVLMAAWALWAGFYFTLTHVPESALWPGLIWAYGVACGPWVYLARKDSNQYSSLSAMFLQIGAIAFILVFGFGGSFFAAGWTLVGVLFFAYLIQLILFTSMRLSTT